MKQRELAQVLVILCTLCLLACHAHEEGVAAETRATRESTPPRARLECPAGMGDCDGNADNGCETKLSSNAHCDACDKACATPSACAYGRCLSGVIELAAGGSHTCTRDAAGALYCFGLSGVGQLGLPQESVQTTPARVSGLPKIRQVVAGRYFTCVLEVSEHVTCFGDRGQLGDEPPTGGPTPHPLPFEGVVQITAGANHACALTKSGEAFCWGGNIKGQLGDGVTLEYQVAPVRVAGLKNASALEAGNAHTCALLEDGQVVCWGDNHYGQLGDGSTEDRPAPTPVAGLTHVTALSAGEYFTCALLEDGHVMCFGRNDQGQLGDGTTEDRPKPTRVHINQVQVLSAGERHTCLCTSKGELYCFGDNGSGRLGFESEGSVATPTKVKLPSPCLSVSAGSMHTCVLAEDESVYCMGQNDGQLGDGTTENRVSPTKAKFE